MSDGALSDAAVARLRELVERPDVAGSRYEVVARIGEGGMGAVYLARDRELGREVALKVLRAPEPTADERARILREARILASLEHPGIVPVHDLGALPDGRVFYVMKHVRGERLDAFARGARPLPELLRVFRQVCEAVAFAHASGVIHRDLKPQNVMLGAFGEVLVLDWGVAKVRPSAGGPHPPATRLRRVPRGYPAGGCPRASAREVDPVLPWGSPPELQDRVVPRPAPHHANATGIEPPPAAPPGDADTEPGTVLGTPGYMAPEQTVGRAAADERTDVYGLGGILVFLLTGEHPSAAVPHEGWRGMPAPLRAICQRARAADPAARYPSVPELAADVANYLDALPVAAHREGIVERARRLGARHRTAILLVAAYLAVRVALLVLGGR